MRIQSCLKSTSNDTLHAKGRVRFAEPIATACNEPIIPGPRRFGPPASAAQCARQSVDPRRPERATASLATAVMVLPHLPYTRSAQLTHLATEQNSGLRDIDALGKLALVGDEKNAETGPVESFARGLNVNLGGVVDAVEDSALMRYGSYAMVTGGALVFVPVATVLLFGCAGLYASIWSVKQLSSLGASSARAVLGLPAPALPRPPSPPQPPALGWVSRDGWPTHTYLDDGNEEEF